MTYMHRIPNNIMILTWNKLEMPTARQRSIHITPILPPQSAESLECCQSIFMKLFPNEAVHCSIAMDRRASLPTDGCHSPQL